MSPIPNGVYLSQFTNTEDYMVVSNMTDHPYELVLRDTWQDRVSGEVGTRFTVPVNRMLFLIRCSDSSALGS